MPIFNGGRIGSNNDPFTGTKSDDPNYSNVSLLLNGNGTNGSTTFTDSSSYGHTVTPVGNAQISTTQSKFGGASMYFDGSGDYLSIPSSASFDFGSGDFTVEFWIYFNNLSGFKNIINKRSSTGSFRWIWFSTYNNSLVVYITSNGSSWDIASNLNFGTVTTGQWYHIALVRNGTEIACYVNGTKSANTATTSSSINFGSENLLVGGDVSSYQTNGYIDDLRITKGIARYTSNFTPPTTQLPGAGTGIFASGVWTALEQCDAVRREIWPVLSIVTDGLVLNLDAGDSASYPGSGNTWTDLSGNKNNGTINGATYDSANGGSLSFDGSNDYVSNVNPGLSDTQVEGELTYEYWLQPTQAIYSSFTQSTSGIDYYSPGTPQGLVSNSSYKYGNQTYAAFMFAFGINGFVAGVHNNGYAPPFLVDYKSYTGVSHLTVIKSVYGCSYYINGVFKKSATQLKILGVVPDRVTSDSSNIFGRYFKGNIYSYRFYNRALTESEITQNFDALKGRYGL